jgi:hypothetical protein
MFTADRDRKNHYLSIIEFDSPQAAIDNMHRPETAEFATKMAAPCDGPPTVHDLDVRNTWPD